MARRIVSSYLFWVVVYLVLVGVSIFSLIPLFAAVYLLRKRFIYEVTLPIGYILYKRDPKKYPSFNKITDQVYLGRIPLKNRGDIKALTQAGITAVLSMVEKFENHTPTLFSDPVTPQDWSKLHIRQLQIESRDFSPLHVSSIEKGVQFIESMVEQGKNVYVHCKAGRTRSSAIIVAYLVKNFPERFSSVEEAIEFVRSLRPIITLSHDKVVRIKDYLNTQASLAKSGA